MNTWDDFYLGLAKYVSTKSKDPSTKVGTVIVDKDCRPVSFGFNGLPQKIKDTPERLNNRDLKYKIIIHGEINSLIFAKRDIAGCTLYCWPFLTCAKCASIFIQAGIARVVAPGSDNPRWQDEFALAREIFAEAGVQVDEVDYGD